MIKIILLPDALEQWAMFAFVCVPPKPEKFSN